MILAFLSPQALSLIFLSLFLYSLRKDFYKKASREYKFEYQQESIKRKRKKKC